MATAMCGGMCTLPSYRSLKGIRVELAETSSLLFLEVRTSMWEGCPQKLYGDSSETLDSLI